MKKLTNFGYVVGVILHGNLSLFPRMKMFNFRWLTNHDKERCWRCRPWEWWGISAEWTILRVWVVFSGYRSKQCQDWCGV